MKATKIHIVQLEPMRVARTNAYGEHPETLARNKVVEWARQRGLLEGPEKPRFFGFDNPSPSIKGKAYGYEVWMTVGPEVEPDVEIGIGIADFPGGLYAVTRYEGNTGKDLKKFWDELVAWVKKSQYRLSRRQWLEEVIGETLESQANMILDLYLPVKKLAYPEVFQPRGT